MRTPTRAIGVALSCVLLAAPQIHSQQATDAATVRFATIDVLIDSRAPLAAWQFELTERNDLMTVVGVENGDSDAFGDAPYYDLETVAAGRADRIIVADFVTGAGADLPVGSTRIATIHVRLSGSAEPNYELQLIAAGDASGAPIDAAIRFNTQSGR